MGYEPIQYKDKSIDSDDAIISRLQKFMELYLLPLNHPDWFQEVLKDLNGNFHVPLGKYFFDEDVLGDRKERVIYSIRIIDQVIQEMETLTYSQFREVIENDVKGTACEYDTPIDEVREVDAYNYQVDYIGCLDQLKRMMLGCHPEISNYKPEC